MRDVKGVASGGEPTENYPSTQQFPSGFQGLLAHCVGFTAHIFSGEKALINPLYTNGRRTKVNIVELLATKEPDISRYFPQE